MVNTMIKLPKNTIKFISESDDGHRVEMSFDGTHMNLIEMTLRFENFLRSLGYVIDEVSDD